MKYMLIREPKSGWRNGLSVQIMVVEAASMSAALKLVPDDWKNKPSDIRMYFTKPKAVVFEIGKEYVL